MRRVLVATRCDRVPLVFAHLCCGVLDQPGALRSSAIATSRCRCLLNQLFRDSTQLILPGKPVRITSHELAFQNHIKLFGGRVVTLLDWISLKAYALAPQDSASTSRRYWVAFLHADQKEPLKFEPQNDPAGGVLTISTQVYNSLVPRKWTEVYLKHLYSDKFSLTSYTTRVYEAKLIWAREQAMSFFKGRFLQPLRALSEGYGMTDTPDLKGLSAPTKDWLFLGALQTGFMYNFGASAAGNVLPGFVSAVRIYGAKNSSPPMSLPLAARGRSRNSASLMPRPA